MCHRPLILAHSFSSSLCVQSYLPNYREFYEKRQFSAARDLHQTTVDLLSQRDIPIGPSAFRLSPVVLFCAIASVLCEVACRAYFFCFGADFLTQLYPVFRHDLPCTFRCVAERCVAGANLLFRCEQYPDFTFHAEVCEDLWVTSVSIGSVL